MTINLTCRASGADNLMYQWMRKGNEKISSQATGANTHTLVISNIGFGDNGEYRCAVSSNGASVNSGYGKLSVISKL